MTVYRCEDSLESIFTAIYRSYEENRDAEETYLALDEDPMLFAEDVAVQPDLPRAVKVMRTLERRFGEEDYLTVCMALASPDAGKAQAVYRTVAKGLDERCARGHLFDDLTDDYVLKTFSLARASDREIQHLKGFLRFQELANGMLYAEIGPKSNVITFLMPHFAERFPMEDFVIHDRGRDLFGIHPVKEPWYLFSGEETELSQPKPSAEELQCQELFRQFCRTISIKERENLKLQRNMLPLRFREYMIEYAKFVT